MAQLPEKNKIQFLLYNSDEDGIIRWLKSISLLSAIIAFVVFTDYFLPLHTTTHVLKQRVVRTGFEEYNFEEFEKLNYKEGEEEYWLILSNEEIAVNEEDLKLQATGDTILLFKTAIFGLHVKLKNIKNTSADYFYPYLSVYGYLLIFPIIFLIIFALNIFMPKNQDLILSLGVINIITLVGFGFLVMFY